MSLAEREERENKIREGLKCPRCYENKYVNVTMFVRRDPETEYAFKFIECVECKRLTFTGQMKRGKKECITLIKQKEI